MKKKNFENSDKSRVPTDGMVQTTGQESADVITTGADSPVPTGTELKEVTTPKNMINITKAAEAVAAGTGSSSASTPTSLAKRGSGVVFSGGAGAIAGDMSATTHSNDSYRSGTRTGRRTDPITRKIDLFTTEVVAEKIDQTKPLDETDAKQGYVGTYFNEHSRAQRKNGGSPADPMFMRSLDEIDLDMIYYPDGQYVYPHNAHSDTDRQYKIKTWDPSLNDNRGGYANDNIDVKHGNYVPKNLHFEVTPDGGLVDFELDTDEISSVYKDEQTYRAASDALLRTKNLIELDRTAMVEKASDQSLPSFSALAKDIPFATEQNRLIRDYTHSIGDMIYLSRRKLSTALSYQCNKTAKDGSKILSPVAEMCNGLVISDPSNPADHGAINSYTGNGFDAVFKNAWALQHGSAGLFIAMNDTVTKYNTKGKFLTLPLSFKSALASVESSGAPFKMHAQLEQLMAKNELFSTIDGPYDGVKPVVITDKVVAAVPFEISAGSFDNDFALYTMHYEELRNKENNTFRNYFLSGIARYLSMRAPQIATYMTRLYRELGMEVPEVFEFDVPAISSTTSISLWDLLVCAATPLMVEDMNISLTPLHEYERKNGYPYSGAQTVGDAPVCAAENFSFKSPDELLDYAIAKPVAAMKVIMPEVFWPVRAYEGQSVITRHNGIAVKTVLPHYFVQNGFEKQVVDQDKNQYTLSLNGDFASMAYPSTRSGQRFSYLDIIYGMAEEDYRLSLDRMVVYPGYGPDLHAIAGPRGALRNDTYGYHCYKYGATADGQPVIPYLAYTTDSSNSDETLTIGDILRTPRELGLCQVAPAGYLTVIPRGTGSSYHTGRTLSINASFLGLSGPGFRAKVYHSGEQTTGVETDILTTGSTQMDWSASLRGSYVSVYSLPTSASYNGGWRFNAQAADGDTFNPFTDGGFESDFHFESGVYTENEVQTDQPFEVRGLHRYLWTRLQRMPFAINPFDVSVDDLTTGSFPRNINTMDPNDFLYALNLCGYRASDYAELIYGRAKQRIAKGMSYVTDPFVDKTMLLK